MFPATTELNAASDSMAEILSRTSFILVLLPPSASQHKTGAGEMLARSLRLTPIGRAPARPGVPRPMKIEKAKHRPNRARISRAGTKELRDEPRRIAREVLRRGRDALLRDPAWHVQ